MKNLSNLTAIVFCLTGFTMAVAAGPVVELKLAGDRPLLPSGETGKVLVKVEVTATQLPPADRPPIHLAIVIDRSGSMSGDRIVHARLGAIEAVKRLGRDDLLTLITFDHEIQTLVAASSLTDVDHVIRLIEGITARGTTNLHGGVERAMELIQAQPQGNRLRRVVLLSDGQANVGPRSPEAFAELGRGFASQAAVVSTIGLGRDYNEQLMRQLALSGEGNNYFVDNPLALKEIFESEIGHMVNTVASSVTVVIELPEGVVFQGLLGRPHRQQGNRLEIDFHDLTGGASKYSVLELKLPAGRDGDALQAMVARAAYRAVRDDSEHTTTAALAIAYTDSHELAREQVNVEVQNAWATLEQARLQDEVLDLVESGQSEKARQTLKAAVSNAVQAGMSPQATAPLRALQAQEEAILQQRTYTREEALTRRTQAYQLRVQQQPTEKSPE